MEESGVRASLRELRGAPCPASALRAGSGVSGLRVVTGTHQIGGREFQVRALADRQQFDDPDGLAAQLGISSAQWSLFGVLWPAGLALAREMASFDVSGKHILELGCGLGLASLVLQERGADITASDHHPSARAFLEHNARLNGLAPIPFHAASWAGPNLTLGDFDLVIGADVLYERGHAAAVASFLGLHARPVAEVLLTDPGRSERGRFRAAMLTSGYRGTDRRVDFGDDTKRGHLLTFTRGAPGPS